MKKKWRLLLWAFSLVASTYSQEREWHYKPFGKGFVCMKPERRFNRAIYGTNTAFRVEAGDLPEFALYMPGMGGNLSFFLSNGNKTKWLIKADHIKSFYFPGRMIYEIKDALLGETVLHLEVLALADAEGMVVKMEWVGPPSEAALHWVYGGATGKKFSRDGDIGADPESSFYLKAENCRDNKVKLEPLSFKLEYGSGKEATEEERYEIQNQPRQNSIPSKTAPVKALKGFIVGNQQMDMASTNQLTHPSSFLQSKEWGGYPMVTGRVSSKSKEAFILVQNEKSPDRKSEELPLIFRASQKKVEELASRVTLYTPDSLLNTLGGALAVAADAIWEDPSYMHGAVAWRMRLNAWRGPYVADVLGWHDRARRHFTSYELSQLTDAPKQGVVMDTALHLARHLEKLGTALFSDGYICRNPGGDFRAHHYDMNLVFIDQLLNHFQWTGDTSLIRQLFPLIKRHLAWEKRNFDTDGDGLYDAYAAIWASDALQYSGGGVAHSSAYNYRANKEAVTLAKILGEDGSAYQKEALKIQRALNAVLWIKDKGVLAEFKDLLGKQLRHEEPAIWTIYHATDAWVMSPLQNYQMLEYVNREIPHIPLRIKGETDSSLFLLSTTNWQPYTWSLNNVALPENLQMALAYWQGGQPATAFTLWRSALIESMYLGASPGNFQQLSFQDAIRGELYRDFADPIGVAARSLVEGLLGIRPLQLEKKLLIRPGYPEHWPFVQLTTPDLSFHFEHRSENEVYHIVQSWNKALLTELTLPMKSTVLEASVEGKKIKTTFFKSIEGRPMVTLFLPAEKDLKLTLVWKGVASPWKMTSNTKPVSTAIKKDWGTQAEIPAKSQFTKINLSGFFNDHLTNIFKNQYLSPRPTAPTLQLPVQGIGNWCYPLVQPEINDSGTRAKLTLLGELKSLKGIPFASVASTEKNNIAYVSQWDNYPREIKIPIHVKAHKLALLMTGSTNAMQCHLTNGLMIAHYKDGSADTLLLRNPENWWPIEQDFLLNGKAFTSGAARPERLLLNKGEFYRGTTNYSGIKGFTNLGIEGGAASILYLNTNPEKIISELSIQAWANDVIIGLMAVTAIHEN